MTILTILVALIIGYAIGFTLGFKAHAVISAFEKPMEDINQIVARQKIDSFLTQELARSANANSRDLLN